MSEIKRDQWGRYKLPDPETGEIKPWTRASTVARTLVDSFALDKWMQRNLVFGLGRRPDLFAKAASVASIDERQTLSKVIDEALEAAASSSKANLGTALHRFAERADLGESVTVPEQWRADIEAYRQTMQRHDITVVDGWTERVLIVPEIQTAGTCDRLLNAQAWKQPKIGDLKTGSNIEAKMAEIALQLAIYAHATHWWDTETDQYHEVPKIDRETAIVMHVPVETGTCTLHEVDIASGWAAVLLAVAVREWRNRKNLSAPIGLSATQTTIQPQVPVAERIAWLRERVRSIVAQEYGQQLADAWPHHAPEVATFRNGGPKTHDEIDHVVNACRAVETVNRLQFSDPDPANIKQPNTIKELTNI